MKYSKKKADKFGIFLEIHPEFKEIFGVNIESHETEEIEEEKKEVNAKQSDVDKTKKWLKIWNKKKNPINKFKVCELTEKYKIYEIILLILIIYFFVDYYYL